MHRMGSYFDPSQGVVNTKTQPPPPKKGILTMSQPSRSPPTPPPTSSIPPKPTYLTPTNINAPVKPSIHMNTSSNGPTSLGTMRSGKIMSSGGFLGARPFNKFATGDRPQIGHSRELQRLRYEHQDMRQIHALNKRLASLTIADMSMQIREMSTK